MIHTVFIKIGDSIFQHEMQSDPGALTRKKWNSLKQQVFNFSWIPLFSAFSVVEDLSQSTSNSPAVNLSDSTSDISIESDISNETLASNRKQPRQYRCRQCNQIKRGHICTNPVKPTPATSPTTGRRRRVAQQEIQNGDHSSGKTRICSTEKFLHFMQICYAF